MKILGTILLLCVAAPAVAGIPCEYFSCWTEGTTTVALVSPGGLSPTLAEQGVVIHVEILDCLLQPIPNFPFQDIWVSDIGNGELSLCQAGSMADANTDDQGRTTISGPIFAGDQTENGTVVWVSGIPALEMGPLDLNFVSPDINGDRFVNLNDFSLFGSDYNTASFRSDFNHDGTVNLNDFGTFGQHYNDQCP